MKKYLMLTLALMMGLSLLTGCGGGESKSKDAEVYSTELVNTMVDAKVFSEELEAVDQATAFSLYKLADYGLSPEDVTDSTICRSAGATCEEGTVLVLADGDKAAQALKALQDYVAGQITANEDYRPNEIPKLEEAIIKQQGNSVLLVVGSDMEAAQSAMK